MSYRIALIHEARFPVLKYGGTERVVWWLAKGLAEMGHQVNLISLPGSQCPFAQVTERKFPVAPKDLPPADLYHYFNTPSLEPESPYLVTIEGNGKSEETFLPNTVFVSQNHAERHGGKAFVYNGLDPDEYKFSEKKDNQLLFLAKASWSVKNVKGAIKIARRSGKELNIVGGSRWWLPHWRGIHWRGMLGGGDKNKWITQASGFLFPVLWHEPFGIAVTESLVSGTPVLASPFGSLKELIAPQVGKICSTYQQFVEGVHSLPQFRASDCRDWAMTQFHYRVMAREYVKYYEAVLSGKKLHSFSPKTPKLSAFSLLEIPEN